MNETTIKKIYELVQKNENVRLQLEGTETIEDIVSILKQNGIEVSVNEIAAAVDTVGAGAGGELDEDALAGVAGGYCKKGRNWRCLGDFMWNYLRGIFDELSR